MMRLTALTVLLLSSLSILGAEDWFLSSPAGLPGEALAQGPASEGWSMSIQRRADEEIRSVYFNGELRSVTTFGRENGRLAWREVTDARGAVVSRVEYAYDSHGNPRATFLELGGEDGWDHMEMNQETTASGTIRRRGTGSGENWIVSELDTSGHPTDRVVYEKGQPVSSSNWERHDNGELKLEVHKEGTDERRILYDAEGRMVEETTIRSGVIALVRRYTWSEGYLVRVTETGEGRESVREIQWTDGRMVRERRLVDGLVISESRWPSLSEKVETLYRDGVAVIRITWYDGVRVREEFLRNGKVIRVREGGA